MAIEIDYSDSDSDSDVIVHPRPRRTIDSTRRIIVDSDSDSDSEPISSRTRQKSGGIVAPPCSFTDSDSDTRVGLINGVTRPVQRVLYDFLLDHRDNEWFPIEIYNIFAGGKESYELVYTQDLTDDTRSLEYHSKMMPLNIRRDSRRTSKTLIEIEKALTYLVYSAYAEKTCNGAFMYCRIDFRRTPNPNPGCELQLHKS